MKRLIRWPVLCTRCGSRTHFVEDCTRIPTMGLSDFEREMAECARRERNCVIGIVATLVVTYFVLTWIGGPA